MAGSCSAIPPLLLSEKSAIAGSFGECMDCGSSSRRRKSSKNIASLCFREKGICKPDLERSFHFWEGPGMVPRQFARQAATAMASRHGRDSITAVRGASGDGGTVCCCCSNGYYGNTEASDGGHVSSTRKTRSRGIFRPPQAARNDHHLLPGSLFDGDAFSLRRRGCCHQHMMTMMTMVQNGMTRHPFVAQSGDHHIHGRGSFQVLRASADAAGSVPLNSGSSSNPAMVDEDVPLSTQISKFSDSFWRFLRPHTIRGTILGTTAVVARALIENAELIDWGLTPRALRGLLALLCGNGYIVGINQIYDIGIDKVNKPFLPIAAGDLPVGTAWALCAFLSMTGVGIVATNFGMLITALYSTGLFLGTLYSVPPFRLKKNPLAAFLIIAFVRGILLNFGVFYATRAALKLPFQWNPSVAFITIFVTMFATAIAITKDLPDVEGDRKFNISTFATRLGVPSMSMIGTGIILSAYVGAVVAALCMPRAFNGPVMIGGHVALAAALLFQAWKLHKSKYAKLAILAFYRFIWNLFYAEYVMFPFI